jgi:NitT/TauT family transport system substrate-binding protein
MRPISFKNSRARTGQYGCLRTTESMRAKLFCCGGFGRLASHFFPWNARHLSAVSGHAEGIPGGSVASQSSGRYLMKAKFMLRRSALAALLAFALVPFARADDAGAKPQLIRFGLPTKAIDPQATNYLIPEQLGYYREGGLTAEYIPLGSVAAAMAALSDGRVEFAAMPASNVIQLAARGNVSGVKAFYEMTYPFKYGIAVLPDSPLHSLAELSGKTVGVSNFGTSETAMGKALLRAAGVDPKANVQWLAVGEGVTAGIALKQKRIAAYIYWDTGFGRIEAAGIPLRFLPIVNPPEVGGIFIFCRTDYLKEHRDIAVAVGRAVAKTSLFIQTNPRAAAYAYIKQFPSAAPKVASAEKQVDAVVVPIKWRMPLYRSKNQAPHKWGAISPTEWNITASFLNVTKAGDLSRLYTNELIDQINKFDESEVVKQAEHAPIK